MVIATVRTLPDIPLPRQVIALFAQWRSNQQIATRLGVSGQTARTHVSNILARLQLNSRLKPPYGRPDTDWPTRRTPAAEPETGDRG